MNRCVLLVVGLLLFVLGCGNEAASVTVVQVPANLVTVAGDAQTGPVDSALAVDPTVEVQDSSDNPIEGVTVNFTVVSGAGSVSPASVVTGSDGQASTSWTLGKDASANQVLQAAVGALTTQFSATPEPGPAASLSRVSGDGQTGDVATTLPEPFVVNVTDDFGNPVAGYEVAFAVVIGNGRFTGGGTSDSVVTDSDGQAQVTLVLGQGAGENGVEASATDLEGSPATFTATGAPGVAATLTHVAGDGQSAIVDTTLPDSLVVQVTDQYGNAVSGTGVEWVVTSGGGTISPSSITTEADGLAQAEWTLGSSAGSHTAEARSPGLSGSPVRFAATAIPALSKYSGDGQARIVGELLPAPVVVRLVDGEGDGVPNAAVTWELIGDDDGAISAADAVTNADGRAQARWTLDSRPGESSLTASAAGYSVTFTANGEPGTVFEDGFEEERGWGLFEEIVGGSMCYGSGIGTVERSTAVAHAGSRSIRVWANQALSTLSDHLLANLKLYERGQNGTFTYVLWAYIDPATGDTGETGPEFSLQNTREVTPGEFRTNTVGVQYKANRHLAEPYRWAIWTETAAGPVGWREVMTQRLTPGEWYRFTLEVDYSANRYLRLAMEGPDVDRSEDLSSFPIVPEKKFEEEAFWLTLEAENLWSNCGIAGPFEYKVYYDDVAIHRR